MTTTARHRIVIMGAGFAGVAAGVRLLGAGERDVVILEQADRAGGTWRDNTYPGCRCDVPSQLYSLSFAPNPAWTRTYPDQPEIWRYLESVAERFEVLPHIRFGHRVLDALWEPGSGWRVRTDRGDLVCQFLISATGQFSEPRTPDIAGASSFAGAVMHSARWDPTIGLDGRRVAVIGTGASAVQIVPSIRPLVSHLDVYQRTPSWVLPHPVRDIPTWQRRLFKLFPPAQRLVRLLLYLQRELVLVPAFTRYDGIRLALERRSRRHLRRQVPDPLLRAKLEPHYELGCKRILPSDDFYPALSQDNVELVTEPIEHIVPEGIVTADGTLHPTEVIVFATGFAVSDNAMAHHVVGREGHRLSEALEGDLPHYLGTTFPWFPNLFVLAGPNTATGHTSQLFMIESQLNHVTDALANLDDPSAVAEVLPSVAEHFCAETGRRLLRSVWGSGCSSWYLNAAGRNVVIWPQSTLSFRRRSRHFDPADYAIALGAPAATTP